MARGGVGGTTMWKLSVWVVGAAIALALPGHAAAKPVEYVKVCSLYGAGFYYIPGTDTCIKISGHVRTEGTGYVANTPSGSFYAPRRNQLATSNALPVTACENSPYGSFRAYVSGGASCADFTRSFIDLAGFTLGRSNGDSAFGIDVGFQGGATIFSPNNAFLRGRDTLAVPPDDRRSLDLEGTSASLGFVVNSWTIAPSFLPLPQGSNVFLQTGMIFPIDSKRSQTVTGVNVIPNATVTSTVEDKWGWNVYAGFSVPAPILPLANTRFRVGGGGTFWNRQITVAGVDTAGPFSATKEFTEFEPGFLLGLRGSSNGFIYGLDVINSFPCGDDVIAQSIFPSQSYKFRSGGGLNTSVLFSISREIYSSNRFIF
jgi:hypothetical protein